MQFREFDQTPDQRVTEMAAGQAGCVARAQVLAAGMTDSMARNRLRRGFWRRSHPGVYVVGGAPHTWDQDVWGAALAVGPQAVISHETALLLHGVSYQLVPRYPITLTVPRGSHHRVRDAVVHQIDDLKPHHMIGLGGLRASRPDRAIVELAATMTTKRLGGLLDHLITERLTTVTQVAIRLGEVARHGKPGVTKLGAVLDERGEGYVPPASKLERLLFEALARTGLPPPSRQVALPGRGALEGLVDAAYLDAKLLIEADGRRWHSRQQDQRRDRLRDAEAARVGWLTLRFLYEQIVEEPEEVAATVADVRSSRLEQLSPKAA